MTGCRVRIYAPEGIAYLFRAFGRYLHWVNGTRCVPYLLIATLLLSACTVGPDYRRPTSTIPGEFKELKGWTQAQPRDDKIPGQWWELFNDPYLNGLERQVNIANQSIAQAEASVLAVAAVDAQKKKLPHSNFGQFVDLSAPGTHVRSAIPQSDDAYALKDGTSAATPMAAAAVAMLRVQYPAYSPEQIEICLKSAAETVDAINAPYEAKLGAGHLDIAAALQCKFIKDDTSSVNMLTHPQGYLRVNTAKTGQIRWEITPGGNLKACGSTC